jgi:LacI family transcriptional regulator
MSLTLEDVARISGYSRSTVSRVINGDPNVNENTRRKILEVVQQLNFQPNLAARSLAAGHTRVLGLVIPRGVGIIFTDPFFPQLIQGVSSACTALDYSVMLWLAEPDYERRTARRILYNGLVDGVIVASQLMDDPIITSLEETSLPFILVGRHPSNTRVNYIDVDNRTASRDAVLHLLHLGRRRVATITGPRNMISGLDRYLGYKDALTERGLALKPELVAEGDFSDESGYLSMQTLFEAQPDAVFAHSDIMAVGALRALHEAGKRVPEDVAVIGFDDLPIAAQSNPPLTTVLQPTARVGILAAETLIDIIDHPETQPRRILLPTELVIRASCGAVRT